MGYYQFYVLTTGEKALTGAVGGGGGACLQEFSLFSVRFYDFILIKRCFFFDVEGALIGMSGNLHSV